MSTRALLLTSFGVSVVGLHITSVMRFAVAIGVVGNGWGVHTKDSYNYT